MHCVHMKSKFSSVENNRPEADTQPCRNPCFPGQLCKPAICFLGFSVAWLEISHPQSVISDLASAVDDQTEQGLPLYDREQCWQDRLG